MKEPFAVTVTGIIWRAINENLSDAIKEMEQVDSPLKDSIYLSWELGFNESNIILLNKDNMNFNSGEIISDPVEMSKYHKNMLDNGGNGFTDDGKIIGRVAIGDVLALGVGLVENPAGQVDPIVPLNEDLDESGQETTAHNHGITKCSCGDIISQCRCSSKPQQYKIIEKGCEKCKKQNKPEEIISQLTINNVNPAIEKNIIINNMSANINKFSEINDEILKTLTSAKLNELFASSSKELIDEGIKNISKDYELKIAEKDKQISEASDKIANLEKSAQELNEKYSKIEKDFSSLVEANQKKEKLELFSSRMETINNKFTLDEKQNDVIANRVKTIDTNEQFDGYLNELEILFAGSKKEILASTENQTATVADVLKNAKPTEVVPNTASTPETLLEKSKRLFGPAGWEVVDKRKNRKI